MTQLPPKTPFVLLDDAGPDRRSRLYCHLQQVNYLAVTDSAAGLDELLADGWANGWHVVLLAPYEYGCAAHGITPRLDQQWPLHDGALRLLWFAECRQLSAENVADWLAESDQSTAPAGVAGLRGNVDQAAYTEAINRIQQLIADGDTYQVNYTYRLHGRAYGDPLHLYRALRAAQPVPYGALACLPGDEWILSVSPELFVRHDGNGALIAQPMKGTAPRSGDAEHDAEAARALAADDKNRAENVMIVDLLRNDLGRVAETGSVNVPALFQVEPFGRVLQMTSTVRARPRTGLRYSELWQALFPCGSITGAPKRRTMQIISEVEHSPRGLYTGTIGWIDPPQHDGVPGAFCLSVVIRTLLLTAPAADGWRRAELGIGSGIVADSVAEEEYEECAWKSRFLRELDPGFGLIETMRVENGRCLHLEDHLARLSAAADELGFICDIAAIRTQIDTHCASLADSNIWRLKLVLPRHGEITLQHAPLTALPPGPVNVCIAEQTLATADPLRAFKTTARAVFDAGWQTAEAHGAFDSLFFNQRGELLEGGRSSVFVRLDGYWLTPPLSLGILPGVMRTRLLRGDVLLDAPAREAVITREMLGRAEGLVLCNALRGVLVARLPDSI